MNKNNNNNFNINNININKLKNYLPENNHTYFFFIIAIVLIVLIILIIRNFLHGASMYQRYVKNVFFREMDELDGKPLDVSGSNGFNICIQGEKTDQTYIENKFLHIKSDYLLMFWVKLESEKISSYINEAKLDVDLISFENTNKTKYYPKFTMNIMNNEMSVHVKDDTIKSKLYNLPYDEWFCLSSYVTPDHMDIYINGKLVKIIEYKVDISTLSIDNHQLKIGPYPGSIAYLQVNNDSSYFNPASVYKEYLVYKALIKRYVDNQYHDSYKITKMRNPHHDNGSYNRVKKTEKPNICSN